MTEYRCEAGCLNCGHFWITRKRNTTRPPARCPECNSSKTYIIRAYIADEKQPLNQYEKVMERMFKEFMKSQGDV